MIKEVDVDLCEYEVDEAETKKLRAHIRAIRVDWARSDPEKVAEMYRKGEIKSMDAVRRYAVILDWETGDPLPKTIAQFRESFERRNVAQCGALVLAPEYAQRNDRANRARSTGIRGEICH